MDRRETRSEQWEHMGAMSGVFAALLFVTAYIIFFTTDPGGGNTPQLPDVANAQAAPAFFAHHLEAIRAQVMLNSIGFVFFLWFLGTLWSVLRRAEGDPGRGSAIAFAGALVGVALTLVSLMLTGTSALTTSLPQAETVPALYTAAALSFAFGGAAFTIFFLGVAEVTLRAGGLPRWLGFLALLAAVASVFGFVTPYYKEGVLNPATGGLGFYAHYTAFVAWVLIAGVGLTLAQFQRRRAAAPAPPGPAAGAEGATP